MSHLISSKGTIGFEKQVSKGTPIAVAAITKFIKYLDDTFATEIGIEELREGGDDELVNTVVKTSHKNKWGLKCYARPNILAYLLAYMLGKDSVSGGGDPYTHTITRSAGNTQWLTFYRTLDPTVGSVKVEQNYDCKISQIQIDGEAGKPITITVSGEGINSALSSTNMTISYSDDSMFTFYDGLGTFSLDSVTTAEIKKFSLKLITKQQALQTDDILLSDNPDLTFDVDFTADLYAPNINFFKKINYYNTSAPSQNLYEGSATINLTYQKSTPSDRQFQIYIPTITFKPVVMNLNSTPKVLENVIAGVARRISTVNSGDIITITLKNGVAGALV